MVDNDVYNNQRKYERYVQNLPQLIFPAEKRARLNKRGKQSGYYIKNSENLKYFNKLITKIEAQDLSYIRRTRLIETLLFISYYTEKDLSKLKEDDIDFIAKSMYVNYKTPASQESFVSMTRRIWWILFKDRVLWKEIRARQDKSKQRQREDKLTPEEYKVIFNYFSKNIEMQFIISLVTESLCRPAELVSCKIKGIHDYQNYALIDVERGKEGIKQLICIDSYPLLKRYLQSYSLRNNPEAFLFTNPERKYNRAIHPRSIAKRLQTACQHLGIQKRISLYSLKRFGVTSKVMMGYSPNDVVKIAGWTSARQLETYNLSTQQEVVESLLVKKGIKNSTEKGYNSLGKKTCMYCGMQNIDFNMDDCPQCLRSLNPEKVRKQLEMLQTLEKVPDLQRLVEVVERLEREVEAMKKLKFCSPSKEIL